MCRGWQGSSSRAVSHEAARGKISLPPMVCALCGDKLMAMTSKQWVMSPYLEYAYNCSFIDSVDILPGINLTQAQG